MRRKVRPGGGFQTDVKIEKLGAKGDGFACFTTPEGTRALVFVPQSVPGDHVRLQVTGQKDGAYSGRILELIASGESRVTPPCSYFGPCGGCTLQMITKAAYADFKAESLRLHLSRHAISDLLCAPITFIPPGTRRRATFVSQAKKGQAQLGFFERKSHGITDIPTCLLLEPRLQKALDDLRPLIPDLSFAAQVVHWSVTMSDTGIDLVIQGVADLTMEDRQRLAAFAEAADIARLSWAASPHETPEPVLLRRKPRVHFSGIPVDIPAAGFLQPSLAGEEKLVETVISSLKGKKADKGLDLFAGCGTFTFALAMAGGVQKVHSVESDNEALKALQKAADNSNLHGRVTSRLRNLYTHPFKARELTSYDMVLFDAPRAGAKAQSEELAKSTVSTILAVSCNAATFARDARILLDGGYKMTHLYPVDQFIWSSHLELVAVFER